MEKETERQDGTAQRAYRLVKKLLDDEERNAKCTLMVMRERSSKSPDASVRAHAIEHERMSKDRLKAVDEARKVVNRAFGAAQDLRRGNTVTLTAPERVLSEKGLI